MFCPRTLFSGGILLIIGCLSACGGGDDGEATAEASTTPVTLSYPNGRLMAVGQFTTGTTTRVGIWQEYFDAPASPQQWRRTYVADTWDQSQDWREWNDDLSIRNDAGDR